MRRAEFMAITPRYFACLVKRHERNIERAERGRDVMLAQIIAMVANTGFKGWEEARQPKEFLPVYGKEPEPQRKRESFDKQMQRTMERAAAYQAGQVARGL